MFIQRPLRRGAPHAARLAVLIAAFRVTGYISSTESIGFVAPMNGQVGLLSKREEPCL
jgi:hypothetical protein